MYLLQRPPRQQTIQHSYRLRYSEAFSKSVHVLSGQTRVCIADGVRYTDTGPVYISCPVNDFQTTMTFVSCRPGLSDDALCTGLAALGVHKAEADFRMAGSSCTAGQQALMSQVIAGSNCTQGQQGARHYLLVIG